MELTVSHLQILVCLYPQSLGSIELSHLTNKHGAVILHFAFQVLEVLLTHAVLQLSVFKFKESDSDLLVTLSKLNLLCLL